MLKTKQFLCDCKNAQVRQSTEPTEPNQTKTQPNPIQPYRTEPNKTRLKWLSVGYISVSENIAGMCKKSCIKLVSTWVTRSGPGCCSCCCSPFLLPPSPVPAACCLWPLAGLIYFKTSQTLEQHVRSTKFLACLTRLGIVLVALVFVALPQLLLLLSLAFAVKKPLKYDAYDMLKCAAHIDETECQKCYKNLITKGEECRRALNVSY